MTLETNRIGTLADGVVLARMGDTSVLVSAVCGWRPSESGDFLPLQVDYREKAFAGGVIPSTYSRREANASDRETLAARIIDRSLRPLFAKGFNYDTQIICSLTSFDKDCDPGMLSIIASSAALHVGSVPWEAGPVGAVRVGWLNSEPVLAPSHEEEEASALNLLYSGTESKTVMMEVGAEELKEGELVRATRFAQAQMSPLIALQHELRRLAGREKKPLPLSTVPEEILQAVHALIFEDARAMYRQHHFNKGERGNAQRLLFLKINETLGPVVPSHQKRFLSAAGDTVMKAALRSLVVEAALKENTLDLSALNSRHCHPIMGPASKPASLPTGDAELVERLSAEVAAQGTKAVTGTTTSDNGSSGSSSSEDDELATVEVVDSSVESEGGVASSASSASSSSSFPFSFWSADDQPDYRLLDASSSCRPDGRGTTDIRPLRADVDVLPVVHGSAVFSRGNTQVLCTATLGPLDQAQQLRLPGGGIYAPSSSLPSSASSTSAAAAAPLAGSSNPTSSFSSSPSLTSPSAALAPTPVPPQMQLKRKAFFLHYDFPPYSTNEVGRVGGANRRMIGHGALAERAMLAVLPDEFDFPYTVRVTSEVTGSDGSSSMATVCGASLALMDAGVPIKRPVAGISIGAYVPAEKYLKTAQEDQEQLAMQRQQEAATASVVIDAVAKEVETPAAEAPIPAPAPVPTTSEETAPTTEPTASENDLLSAAVAASPAASPSASSASAPALAPSPAPVPLLVRLMEAVISAPTTSPSAAAFEAFVPSSVSNKDKARATALAAIEAAASSSFSASSSSPSSGFVMPKPSASLPAGSQDSTFFLLTDIFGLEDHSGDMDFKVAGTRYGVTGLQLDVKPQGLPLEVLEQALWRAKDARLRVLDVMHKAMPKARSEVKATAPKMEQLLVPQELIGRIIGPGGAIMRRIQETTGARLNIERPAGDGLGSGAGVGGAGGAVSTSSSTPRVSIYATADSLAAAKEMIHSALDEHRRMTGSPLAIVTSSKAPVMTVGSVVQGQVMKVLDFGAVVGSIPSSSSSSPSSSLTPSHEIGWLHVSELTPNRNVRAPDLLKPGDLVTCQVVDVDVRGRGKLSIRTLLKEGERIGQYINRGTAASSAGAGADASVKEELPPLPVVSAPSAAASSAYAPAATTDVQTAPSPVSLAEVAVEAAATASIQKEEAVAAVATTTTTDEGVTATTVTVSEKSLAAEQETEAARTVLPAVTAKEATIIAVPTSSSPYTTLSKKRKAGKEGEGKNKGLFTSARELFASLNEEEVEAALGVLGSGMTGASSASASSSSKSKPREGRAHGQAEMWRRQWLYLTPALANPLLETVLLHSLGLPPSSTVSPPATADTPAAGTPDAEEPASSAAAPASSMAEAVAKASPQPQPSQQKQQQQHGSPQQLGRKQAHQLQHQHKKGHQNLRPATMTMTRTRTLSAPPSPSSVLTLPSSAAGSATSNARAPHQHQQRQPHHQQQHQQQQRPGSHAGPSSSSSSSASSSTLLSSVASGSGRLSPGSRPQQRFDAKQQQHHREQHQQRPQKMQRSHQHQHQQQLQRASSAPSSSQSRQECLVNALQAPFSPFDAVSSLPLAEPSAEARSSSSSSSTGTLAASPSASPAAPVATELAPTTTPASNTAAIPGASTSAAANKKKTKKRADDVRATAKKEDGKQQGLPSGPSMPYSAPDAAGVSAPAASIPSTPSPVTVLPPAAAGESKEMLPSAASADPSKAEKTAAKRRKKADASVSTDTAAAAPTTPPDVALPLVAVVPAARGKRSKSKQKADVAEVDATSADTNGSATAAVWPSLPAVEGPGGAALVPSPAEEGSKKRRAKKAKAEDGAAGGGEKGKP